MALACHKDNYSNRGSGTLSQHDTTRAPQWHTPEELALEATLPAPSELEWRLLSEHLVRQQTACGIRERAGPDCHLSIDFWKTYGKWFAAILSAESDSILVYRLIIGKYLGASNDLEFYFAGEDELPIVAGSDRTQYLAYRQAGELWKLFQAGRFWESESSWDDLYNRTGLMIDAGHTYRMISQSGVDDILPHRARGKKRVPTGRNLWLLQIGFLAAQNGIVTEDTAMEREYPACGVDFLVFYDNWFGAIVSRYSDTGIVYRAIVGQHMADSILYRYVDDSARVLDGDEVKTYKRLAEHDSLWSLVGSLEKWQDQAALERQWQESENRRRPDSSAIETKVLRLGPPPKQ